jgi:hypothetical protein
MTVLAPAANKSRRFLRRRNWNMFELRTYNPAVERAPAVAGSTQIDVHSIVGYWVRSGNVASGPKMPGVA